ncbi:hypothetical protein GW17_00060115, partial [Ensete ventricosum]
VEVRSVFHTSSRKLKILPIPNVFANGKTYEYGFMKKFNGHKICANSRFDQFFANYL